MQPPRNASVGFLVSLGFDFTGESRDFLKNARSKLKL